MLSGNIESEIFIDLKNKMTTEEQEEKRKRIMKATLRQLMDNEKFNRRLFELYLEKYKGDIDWLFNLAISKNNNCALKILAQRINPDSEMIRGATRFLGQRYRFLRDPVSWPDMLLRLRLFYGFMDDPSEVFKAVPITDHYPLYLELLGEVRDAQYRERLLSALKTHYRMDRMEKVDLRILRDVGNVEEMKDVLTRYLYDAMAEKEWPDDKIIRLLRALPWLVSDRNVLHLAVLKRRVDVVVELLRLGADPLARDGAGKTPLHHALRMTRQHQVITALMSKIGSLSSIIQICLEVLLDSDGKDEALLKVIETTAGGLKVLDVTEEQFRLMDRAIKKVDRLKHVFLPVFAKAGFRNRVKNLIRAGARAEPVGSVEMRTLMREEMDRLREKRIQQETQARQLALSPEIVALEREVSAGLGVYDASALGLGAAPVIRAEAPEELSPAEIRFITERPRVAGDPLPRLYRRFIQGQRQLLDQIRQHIPPTYRIVVAPDVSSRYKDESGIWTRPLRDDEFQDIPEDMRKECQKRKYWHEIVSGSRQETMKSQKPLSEYREFLEDILTNVERIRQASHEPDRQDVIPIRWTDDPDVVERRRELAEIFEPVIQGLYNGLQKKTVVLAIDTINVLRRRDPALRELDYTDPGFQQRMDESFERHHNDIAGALETAVDRTTIVWVYPRIDQREDVRLRHTTAGGNHRRVVISLAVRLDDLRFTRSLDDFFLLSLAVFYRRSTAEKVTQTGLVLVSGDKFRDWSVDVRGLDAAWEGDDSQKIQQRAKRLMA